MVASEKNASNLKEIPHYGKSLKLEGNENFEAIGRPNEASFLIVLTPVTQKYSQHQHINSI